MLHESKFGELKLLDLYLCATFWEKKLLLSLQNRTVHLQLAKA